MGTCLCVDIALKHSLGLLSLVRTASMFYHVPNINGNWFETYIITSSFSLSLNEWFSERCICQQISRIVMKHSLVICEIESKDQSIMWRSHQPRFHPDLNRGLYRERVGVVLSAPIRSYHVLMSILTIGLIVENFWLPKKSSRLTRLPRLSGPSHQIV